MERNCIWDGDTYFYIDLEEKTFGCRINKKEISRAKEIIKYFKNTRKEQIKAWRKEWKLTTEDFINVLTRFLDGKRDVTKDTYKLMKTIYFKEVMNNGYPSINNSVNQVVESQQV